jgi:DNA-binding XRE family transcriptional regulator
MVQRREPTARQMRLGGELRKLREAAGLTAIEAAALLGANRVQISHIESGLVGVRSGYVGLRPTTPARTRSSSTPW